MAYFDHSFGVEIECYLPAGVSRANLATAISERIGRANSCRVESYGHNTPDQWKIVTDGSLSDYTSGVEIVSPVLVGAGGLAQVEIVCNALNDIGCTVNKKCGLHVHVGVGNATLRFWKDLVCIYSVFESVIDKMMPNSRRESNSSYCQSMTRASVAAIQNCFSLSAVQGLFGSTSNRYNKVNLAAYARHRTVEFRQHSGTTDVNKVRNWVIICLSMVEAAKAETFNVTAFSAVARNNGRRGTKNYMIGEMVLRPQGVTSQEALAATGWSTISVPEIARFCGISVTKQKRGRITRYFAVQSIVSVNPDTFANTIKLDATVRSYVTQRINNLSGNVAWAA